MPDDLKFVIAVEDAWRASFEGVVTAEQKIEKQTKTTDDSLKNLGNTLAKVAEKQELARIRAENHAKAMAAGTDFASRQAAALDNLANKYLSLGSAIALAYKGIALEKQAIDLAASLDILSQRTGATVQTLSALRVVAENSGSSIESIAHAYRFLGQQVTEANSGNKKAQELFKSIGVTAEQLRTQSLDQLFEHVARSITGMGSAAEKDAASMAFFRRSGDELIPMMKIVADEGLQGIIDKGTEAGYVMDERLAASAHEMKDKWNELRAALETAIVTPELLDSLTELATALATVVKPIAWLVTNAPDIAAVAGLLNPATAIPTAQALAGYWAANRGNAPERQQRDQTDYSAQELGETQKKFSLSSAEGGRAARQGAELDKLQAQLDNINQQITSVQELGYYEHQQTIAAQGTVGALQEQIAARKKLLESLHTEVDTRQSNIMAAAEAVEPLDRFDETRGRVDAIFAQQTAEEARHARVMEDAAEERKQQEYIVETTQRWLGKAREVSDVFRSGIGASVQMVGEGIASEIVDGTFRWRDALKDVAKQFLANAIEMGAEKTLTLAMEAAIKASLPPKVAAASAATEEAAASTVVARETAAAAISAGIFAGEMIAAAAAAKEAAAAMGVATGGISTVTGSIAVGLSDIFGGATGGYITPRGVIPGYAWGGPIGEDTIIGARYGEGVVNQAGMRGIGREGLNYINHYHQMPSGGGDVHIHIHNPQGNDGRKLAREIIPEIKREINRATARNANWV